MSIYLFAQLKIKDGKLEEFQRLLLDEIAPRLEPCGWKLVGSWLSVVGAVNPHVGSHSSVVDIWELPNIGAFETCITEATSRYPEYMELEAQLGACVIDEQMQFLYKLGEPLGENNWMGESLKSLAEATAKLESDT